MPLQQKTFTLVPNAPQFFNGPPTRPSSKPPMTTKQARKLYNQQTRGPRRTKAEQRAWERAEQERIRQELEKDKAANKARAVRERKKAKEKAELEEKRRLGLPTAKVRPSQDTISRFLRSFGPGVRQKSGEAIAEAKAEAKTEAEVEAEVEAEAEGDAEAETKAGGASDRESRSPRAGKRRRLNPLEPELQVPPKPPSSVAVASTYDCLPPTSTQAFLLKNIDDIFPTPSQEARELFEDENRLPPLSRPVRPPPPLQPPSSRSKFLQPSKASTEPSDTRGIPPQRFLRPGAPLRAATQRNDLVHRPTPPLPKRALPPHPSPVSDIPFFSTQDVVLSSQDIREVEQRPSSSRTVACPVRPTPRRVLEEIQCDYGAMSGISSTQETFYGDIDLGEAIALLEGESQ